MLAGASYVHVFMCASARFRERWIVPIDVPCVLHLYVHTWVRHTVKPILQLLHASHSGMNKTLVLARSLYYWPGMVNDVKQLISRCTACARVQPSQPFTPMVTSPPSSHLGYPMQHVGLDLFSYGNKQHLICVDHWSGYPLYPQLRSCCVLPRACPSLFVHTRYVCMLCMLSIYLNIR